MYKTHVARNLFEVFLSCYTSVDAAQRAKMDKLLFVWQKYGRFDRNLLGQIEYEVNAKRASLSKAGGQGRGAQAQRGQPQQLQNQQQQLLNPEMLSKLGNLLPQLLESQKKANAAKAAGSGRARPPQPQPQPQVKVKQERNPPAAAAAAMDYRNAPDPTTSLLSSEDEEEEKPRARAPQPARNGGASARKRKREEEKPAEVGFSASFLGGRMANSRHEFVIDALYFDQTHQCMQTGKRFRDKEGLQRHLDVLFFRKKLERESELSRKWYVPDSIWAASAQQEDPEKEGKAENMEEDREAAKVEEEASISVVADPSVKACAISGEKFHTFYNDGDDQWHFRDALRLKSPYQGVAAGSYVLRSSLPPEIRERELS